MEDMNVNPKRFKRNEKSKNDKMTDVNEEEEEEQPFVSAMEIFQDIRTCNQAMSKITVTYDLLSSIDTITKKRKQIEEFLDYENILMDPNVIKILEEIEYMKTKDNEFMAESDRMSYLHHKLGKYLPLIQDSLDLTKILDAKCPIDDKDLKDIFKLVEDGCKHQIKKPNIADMENTVSGMLGNVISDKEVLLNIKRLTSLLKSEISKLRFPSDKKFNNNEARLLSDLKCLTDNILVKKKSQEGMDYCYTKQYIDDVHNWWLSKEECINALITYYVCNYNIRREDTSVDDICEFKRISDLSLEILNRENRFLKTISWKTLEDIKESKDEYTFLPLRSKFAFRETWNNNVVFTKNDDRIKMIMKCLETLKFYNKINLPKLLCAVDDGDKHMLIFDDSFNGKKKTERSWGIYKRLSPDHLHGMILQFSLFLEFFAKKDYNMMIKEEDIYVNGDCQINISPTVFQSLFKIKSEDPIEIQKGLECIKENQRIHPDTEIKRNYYTVYVALFLELVIFSDVSMLDEFGGKKKFSRLKTDCKFKKELFDLMDRIYVPNNSVSERQIKLLSGNICNISPATETCVLCPLPTKSWGQERTSNEYRSLVNYNQNGVDLGHINRKTDTEHKRMNNYIKNIMKCDLNNSTSMWKFKLLDEDDKSMAGNTNAQGKGPCKELILDLFNMALKHSVFREIEGKIFFSSESRACIACKTDDDAGCKYLDNHEFYEALGRATQLAMVLGVAWPKKFAKITLYNILNMFKVTTREMCYDVFPFAKKLVSQEQLYGKTQLDDEGEIMNFNLERIKDTFFIPDTVDLYEYFPILNKRLTVSKGNVISHLSNWLDGLSNVDSQCFWFRIGLGAHADNNAFWNLYSNTSLCDFEKIFSVDSNVIDPEEFISKIKFGRGFKEVNGNERETEMNMIRKRYFIERFTDENNHRDRFNFLTVSTASNCLKLIKNGSIHITMKEKHQESNIDSWSKHGGVHFMTCSAEVIFPYFEELDCFNKMIDSTIGEGYGSFNSM